MEASGFPTSMLLRLPTASPPHSHLSSKTLTLISLRSRTRSLFTVSSLSKSPNKPSLTPAPFHRSLHLPCPFPSSPLLEIKPYLQSEWQPILKGWILSALSVYCLSLSIPRIGRLPSTLTGARCDRMVSDGLILALLACSRSIASYLQQAFLWEAALRSAYKMRAHVFDRVLERDLGFFEGNDGIPSGDIAHRITAEASDVADTVYALLNTVVPNTLQLFAMATQMVMLSPILTMISALVIPCISLVIGYLGEKLRKISRKARVSSAKLSTYLNEVLPSMLIVKANIGELNESSRLQRLAHEDMVQCLKKRKMKAFIPQIVQVIYLGGLVVLCAGSLVVSRNFFDVSSLLSFMTSLALLIEPIQGVGKACNELKEGEPAIERLLDLTRFNSKVTEEPDAVELVRVTGDIKFCDVTFKYGKNMPLVLNGVNLHVKAGETVALIGTSGGGKTTLTKLLLRLYDPLCGRILVDNIDVKDIRQRSLREHIILVPQDLILSSGTVAENIGYRDLAGKINMKRVENAARIANADAFIRSLPEGYETNIGQRGSLLSGGQKQRLAIARALYHESSILILDEATSALDSRSELLVRQALENLMSNHTVLVIAHRLETVMMADRVVLLNRGKLEEVAKSSLLAQDGQHASPALGELII